MDRRPYSWRWASAASARVHSPPPRTFNSPEATHPRHLSGLPVGEESEVLRRKILVLIRLHHDAELAAPPAKRSSPGGKYPR